MEVISPYFYNMHSRNIYIGMLMLFCVACTDSSSISPQLPAFCDFESLKGESLIVPTDSCRKTPWPPQPQLGFNRIYPDTNSFLVAVSPNSEFQFAFINYGFNSFPSTSELWIKDLCTGEARYVTDHIGPQVDWSRKDWLVYAGPNRNIWKIKSNGDSLTQLTFGATSTSPNWNDAGDKVVFIRPTDPGEVMITIDENGEEITRADTTYGITGITLAPDDKQVLAFRFPHTYILDLSTLDSTRIDIMKTAASGATWANDSKSIYWTASQGVFKTDIQTLVTDTIAMHSCNNSFYRGIRLASSANSAFFRATIRNPVEIPDLYVEDKVYWIDFLTGETREVFMD